jgi:hypothetical protein
MSQDFQSKSQNKSKESYVLCIYVLVESIVTVRASCMGAETSLGTCRCFDYIRTIINIDCLLPFPLEDSPHFLINLYFGGDGARKRGY